MSIRVLVVDDEKDFLDPIVRRLELRGMTAVGVTSGTAALELLDSRTFDVVVLDIKMPGMGGLEALREIKHKHAAVEVIVLTGHVSQEFNRMGLDLGAFDYLVKPVKLETVVERIEAACGDRGTP